MSLEFFREEWAAHSERHVAAVTGELRYSPLDLVGNLGSGFPSPPLVVARPYSAAANDMAHAWEAFADECDRLERETREMLKARAAPKPVGRWFRLVPSSRWKTFLLEHEGAPSVNTTIHGIPFSGIELLRPTGRIIALPDAAILNTVDVLFDGES